jgi:hypothetical protein
MPRRFTPQQLKALRQNEVADHKSWARQTSAWLQKKLEQIEKDRAKYSALGYQQLVKEARDTARFNLQFYQESLHTVVDPVLSEKELHGLESYLIDARQDETDSRDHSKEARETRMLAEIKHGIRELALLQRVKHLDDEALIERAKFATRTKDPQLLALVLEEARARQSAGTRLQVETAAKGLLETMPELGEAEAFFEETEEALKELEYRLILVDNPRDEYASAFLRAHEIEENRQAREFVQHVAQEAAAREQKEKEQKSAQQRVAMFQEELKAEAKKEELIKKANGKEPSLPPAA